MSLQIKSKQKKRRPNSPQRFVEGPKDQDQSFLGHLTELRNRVIVVAICITVGALFAYVIQKQLIDILVRPAHGQHFIYTSPIGGVGFLFSLSTDFGILIAIPIIVYELLSFINPVFKHGTRRMIAKYCILSGLLAFAGVIAGYLVGLPLVLNFLAHPFSTSQIQPLFTISEYLSFVSLYLFGCALIFQIPLIIGFINRITPLKPKTMFKYERYVVVAAFIISAIMAPTINVLDLFIIAGPIILVYNLAIGFIWYVNRGRLARDTFKARDQEAMMMRQKVQPTPAVPELPITALPQLPAIALPELEEDDRPSDDISGTEGRRNIPIIDGTS